VQNFQRAARLYREGCENKHAESCFRLSEMMSTGAGTWRDPREAARYRRMACQGGYAEACIAPKRTS
jgi:TPR repeat protein